MEWSYIDIIEKYNKQHILMESEEIRKYLPETKWLDKKCLRTLLKKYKIVYLKPSWGGGGNGIFKVERIKSQEGWQYSLHFRKRKKWFTEFKRLYRTILRKIRKLNKERHQYLVQQGIKLLQFENCLFDIRSVVQLHVEQDQFIYRGNFVRLGAPNKIVTNMAKGGKAMSLDKVLAPYMNKDEVDEIQHTIQTVSVHIASLLRKKCSKVMEAGLDFGLDQDFKLWLIKVNLEPRYKGFKEVNIEVYREIAACSKELRELRTELEMDADHFKIRKRHGNLPCNSGESYIFFSIVRFELVHFPFQAVYVGQGRSHPMPNHH